MIYDSWKRDSQFAKYLEMIPLLQVVNLNGKSLDIGIGTALFEEFLKSNGTDLDVVGIDPDPMMLNEARKRGYNVVQGIAEKLPFENESFDFVICLDAMHAVKDQPKAMDEIRRVLKPGGHMLISLFCNTFTQSAVVSELDGLVTNFELCEKKTVGRKEGELSAVALCRK